MMKNSSFFLAGRRIGSNFGPFHRADCANWEKISKFLRNKEIFQFSKFPWVLLEPVFSKSLIAD